MRPKGGWLRVVAARISGSLTSENGMLPVMASTHEPQAESVPAARQAPPALELEEELLRAEADFARGDFIELSREELDHCIQTGESPWPDASRG